MNDWINIFLLNNHIRVEPDKDAEFSIDIIERWWVEYSIALEKVVDPDPFFKTTSSGIDGYMFLFKQVDTPNPNIKGVRMKQFRRVTKK